MPPVETADLCKWLRSQKIDKAAQPHAARAIMKYVLELRREDPIKVAPIVKSVVDHAKLLQLVLQPADGTRLAELQACLCLEVQYFCRMRGWPPELINKIFFQLHEKSVVSDVGFLVWREKLATRRPARTRLSSK